MKLSKGMEVKDIVGRTYVVKEKIGEGAQGTVYDTENGAFLIKVIRAEENKRYEIVNRFKWIMKQNISNEARIITPISILKEPYIGYVMKKARGHESLNKYLYPDINSSLGEWYNVQTGGIRKRLEIAISLSKCYRQLHLQGLCYCDVSPNNILVASNQRSIVLIDSDNLTSPSLFSTSILGTPRYIAPELFSLNRQPNSITDTYAFAVILFELLRLGHPLVGDMILEGTPEEEEEAVKGHALYVDHPVEDSNRNSSILPASIIFTKELQELFKKMFVDGLHEYMKRPTLYEFTSALQQAEDQLVQCDNELCHAYFYRQEGEEQICPWCDEKKQHLAMVELIETSNISDQLFENEKMKISRPLSQIVLNSEAKAIYRRHVEPYVTQEADKVIAIVKKMDHDYLVIRNCSSEDFMMINKVTRAQEVIKPEETKKLNIREDNVVFNLNKDVDEICEVFGKNNIFKSIVFTIN
ncbi:protein kinase domain-containing protein [Niallia sp. MER TA 168]|uniref:protein kinase domain-containing protein n=1 Tax=Niallia sp. MER TA 168 TaxID=2939568 RepID=UPI00204206E3|nr:protein kinase [Niallia sp. MER TA 168]MCM3364784.1 protein kinase [Niallia sp. MER TA 168]